MASTGIAPCPACDQLIIIASLPGGIPVTLNRLPDEQGLVAAQQTALGAWHARRETPGIPLDVTEHRYSVHDCGAENAPETPAGVAQLDAWRKAESGHRRQQRNQRGQPNTPAINSVRRRAR